MNFGLPILGLLAQAKAGEKGVFECGAHESSGELGLDRAERVTLVADPLYLIWIMPAKEICRWNIIRFRQRKNVTSNPMTRPIASVSNSVPKQSSDKRRSIPCQSKI